MSDFTKLHLSHEIFRILPVFSQFFYRWLITSVGLEKCKKKRNAVFFKLFWYKVFVP